MSHAFQLDHDIRVDPTQLLALTNQTWTLPVTISDRWQVIVGPNGGYLGALLLGCIKTLPIQSNQTVRSVALSFISPSVPGPASMSLRCVKAGRTTSMYTAELIQNDRTIAMANAHFAAKRLDAAFCDQVMPDVSPASQIAPTDWQQTDSKFAVPFRQHFDQRIAIGPTPGTRDGSGRIGGWMRFMDCRPLDDIGLLAMSDAWYPSIISRHLDYDVHVPTIDHTVHFIQNDFSALPDDAYTLFEFSTELAQDGYLVENGRMFSSSGALIAVSRQMAAMVQFEPGAPAAK